MSRPGILVLNQYYRPGVEATANLLADLCEDLAQTYDVTVVTGRLQGRDDLPNDEVLSGVRVAAHTLDVPSSARKISQRGINYVTYMADSFVRALSIRRPALVLCMTDPPIVGDLGVAIARRFRAPLLVISEDVFPEIATELGRLTNPLLVRVLRGLVGFYLKRADHIVAIGGRMRERLIAKGAEPGSHHRDPELGRHHLRRARCLVTTIGHANRSSPTSSSSCTRATSGTRRTSTTSCAPPRSCATSTISSSRSSASAHATPRSVSSLDGVDADKVCFMPYQPRELLPDSLGSAHLHYVGLAKGLSGFVVPSRLYGVLSAGRPVIVAADPDSETARLVEEVGCGVAIPPDRPDLLAGVIRDAYDGRLDLDDMGRRGREYVEREADRSVALARYRGLIDRLVHAGPRP